MTKNTTDRAAEIRAALKAKHITSRQVSVRADYFSMGSSITITIKDANVRASVVSAIANQHESISRCHLTGEILSGGNRYVSVSYASATLEEMAARYLPQVAAAVAQITDNALIPVEGTPFMVGRGNYGLSVWGESGHLQACYDAATVAQEVGVRMLDVIQ